MPANKRSASVRKPRADAQRNRERILVVAKAAFTKHGADASLDEIARRAGVGPGTLYRHFADREALLLGVYRNDTEKLAAAGPALSAVKPPLEALRAWLLLLVDAIAAKKLIGPALTVILTDPQKKEACHAALRLALQTLVDNAIASGDLCGDVHAQDFLRALVGVSHVSDGPEWEPSARRLVDLLLAGARRA